MPEPNASDPRYPIGEFSFVPFANAAARLAAIEEIRDLPRQIRAALHGLSAEQLDTPYRDGGWTVRQLTHHVADSHINAYVRFRLGLTEDTPTIKPYDENAWVQLADSTLPVEPSLAILDNLHHRWSVLLDATPEAHFARSVIHPASGSMSLDKLLQLYSWHGRHHVAHILHAPR